MGLLQKASLKRENTEDSRRSKFSTVLESLENKKNSLDFYSILFSELKSILSIEKGALLTKEGEIFSLYSITGFDETTKNRLRLTSAEYREFKETNNISILQKYFSIREFVTTNEIEIFPIKINNKIEALLLITEYAIENHASKNEIQTYLTSVEKILEDNPYNKLLSMETQFTDIKDSITKYLQEIKNSDNRIILLKLNTNQLIEQFKIKESLSTESSIKNSVIKLLTSFINKKGRVFQLLNNDILITLKDSKNSTNIVIIQQQISTSLGMLFSKPITDINLQFESLIWSNNSLDTILDHFIKNENSRD